MRWADLLEQAALAALQRGGRDGEAIEVGKPGVAEGGLYRDLAINNSGVGKRCELHARQTALCVAALLEGEVKLRISARVRYLERGLAAVLGIDRFAGRDLLKRVERGWIQRMDRVGAARVAVAEAQDPTVKQ